MSTYALSVYDGGSILSGRVTIANKVQNIPWQTIEAEDVIEGTMIPADTNVIIHIPETEKRLYREVLFGQKGKETRYWGYCFPEGYDVKRTSSSSKFLGKIFLSEAERAHRKVELAKRSPTVSLSRLPTDEELKAAATVTRDPIRHQVETFQSGTTCYIMSEAILAVGIDEDSDKLNTSIENDRGTDTDNPDTDGDGISDGNEVLKLKSDPLRRDSDGDGLVDGFEDKNFNGKREKDETDVLNMDSDRDGLCDGYCRMGKDIRTCSQFGHTDSCDDSALNQWSGEDKDLSGTVEEGETDPVLEDTDGDGASDGEEYWECVLEGGGEC